MKFLLSLLFGFFVYAQNPDISTLRNLYTTASLKKENADKFYNLASQVNSSDAVSKGYQAASKIIESKFEKSIHRQTLVTSGIRSLERLIKENPSNTELRLIRLSLQENLPKIVRYNAKISEDRGFIIRNFAKQSDEVKTLIRNYAKMSKTLSEQDFK